MKDHDIIAQFKQCVNGSVLFLLYLKLYVKRLHHYYCLSPVFECFFRAGIRSVINLQQPKEHESCGYGNETEGFSYRPSDFMEHEIFYYNFGWKDYGVGSLENIMDMVKVMQFAVSQGKVAVHCHAGLGTVTYLFIAYLSSGVHDVHCLTVVD